MQAVYRVEEFNRITGEHDRLYIYLNFGLKRCIQNFSKKASWSLAILRRYKSMIVADDGKTVQGEGLDETGAVSVQ
jgi:hypothetical protein